jgi:methylene-fatty-acyl-phospholipid synthase
MIAFLPLYWNVVGRIEYKNKFFSKLCFNNIWLGAYGLAGTTFMFSAARDYAFLDAIKDQAQAHILGNYFLQVFGYVFIVAGSILVGSSFYRLGITGTYHGDHFGILKTERVTSFPFNVIEHPMYVGATLNFLGTAIKYKSPAGILLTIFVYVCYYVAAEYFESSFTAKIYEDAAKAKATQPVGSASGKPISRISQEKAAEKNKRD